VTLQRLVDEDQERRPTMLDPQVTQLLDKGINTSCKLATMLRFADQREFHATAPLIASRICRDIWSVQSALDELVEDGLLIQHDHQYSLVPSVELRKRLLLLRETYESPLQRLELQRLLRDLERYAPYRNEFPRPMLMSRVA
jgi:hypothetical protein